MVSTCSRQKLCGSIILCHSRGTVAAFNRRQPFRIKFSRNRKRITVGSSKLPFGVKSWGETCYTYDSDTSFFLRHST